MIVSIVIGVLVMMLCLLVQSVLLIAATRYHAEHEGWLRSPRIMAKVGVVAIIMVMLVLGNLCQGAIWALLFMQLGEFADFSTAYYHSLVNFATLGYGDIVMSEQWRLLGPIQAINGVLMIGISTAGIGSVTQDVMYRAYRERHGGEEPPARPLEGPLR